MLRLSAVAALALAACAPAPATPPAFELVAYADTSRGLESFVLDSGLTVDDCAQALALPARYPMPDGARLLTCESK